MLHNVFKILLCLLCCCNCANAQELTEYVKKRIHTFEISAETLTKDIAINSARVKKVIDEIKEKGSYPFFLINGKIKDISVLEKGCIITLKGVDFQELLLYSANDEDVFHYYVGQEVYTLASLYQVNRYNHTCDVAILSKSLDGLTEKVTAIVNAIEGPDNKYELLKSLLDVKARYDDKIGMSNSIDALKKFFKL